MLKSYAALTKAFQAIATEAADYSKKPFEDSVAHIEKISTVKSVEAASTCRPNM